MNKKHLIMWQKWSDPFAQDDNDEIAEEFDPYTGSYTNEDEDENMEDKDIKNFLSNKQMKHIKAIATPMGIIPVNDNTASGKLFNFWVGHTNFDISKKIANIIEKTDGVETLDIFTRYRFRIAVGKAFDDSEIMRNINKTIYSELSYG
jgi:hypothetical protein